MTPIQEKRKSYQKIFLTALVGALLRFVTVLSVECMLQVGSTVPVFCQANSLSFR